MWSQLMVLKPAAVVPSWDSLRQTTTTPGPAVLGLHPGSSALSVGCGAAALPCSMPNIPQQLKASPAAPTATPVRLKGLLRVIRNPPGIPCLPITPR
jgi:hypothetical protein